jgi:hypothetical protein
MRAFCKIPTHEQARQIFYSELSWQQEPEFNSDPKFVTDCEKHVSQVDNSKAVLLSIDCRL